MQLIIIILVIILIVRTKYKLHLVYKMLFGELNLTAYFGYKQLYMATGSPLPIKPGSSHCDSECRQTERDEADKRAASRKIKKPKNGTKN